MNLIDYIERQRQWSLKTFGDGRRTKGITSHIKKELQEIESNPTDVIEWIDVVILALDGAWRSGHTAEEIVEGMQNKQGINFKRIYPMPTSQDEASEHLK